MGLFCVVKDNFNIINENSDYAKVEIELLTSGKCWQPGTMRFYTLHLKSVLLKLFKSLPDLI